MDTHFGLTEDAKPRQKAYYIKEGVDEQEAERRVQAENKRMEVFKIVTRHVSAMQISWDNVMGRPYDPPRKLPAHHFVFADSYRTFHLYIPEASGHAILSEPTGMMDASWVNVRFGQCRKVNAPK